MEEAAASAATIVVGFVRSHFNDVFLTDNRFNDETEIFGYLVAIALADDLAGVLNGKRDSPILVPVGTYLQPPLPDPFGIVLVDGGNFEVMVDVEFFQSRPD